VRREDVERAAEELFSEKGYHATSMQDLAERLNLQRGSLYAHIESKEELLFAVVRRAAQEFWRETAPARAPGLCAPRRLRLAVEGHMRVIAEHSHGSAVFLTEWRHLRGARLAQARALRDGYEELYRDIVAQGVQEGSFAVTDATVARMAVLSVLNWAHQWFRRDGRLGPEEAAQRLADVLLAGLMGAVSTELAHAGRGRA
jgi:AcrR family transcriptional regulator